MKNIILPLFFAASIFCPTAPAGAQENQQGLTREQAERIADLVSRPAREVIKPAVDNAVNTVAAASWALWDIMNGMDRQQKAGEKPDPDQGLVEIRIRLTMRCASGQLCLRQGSSCKAYPRDSDFAKAAFMARTDIKTYAAKHKGKSLYSKQHTDRIAGFMETARKKMIFSLPMTRETTVQPSPATPGETKYIQLAEKKKKGPNFTFPPWP